MADSNTTVLMYVEDIVGTATLVGTDPGKDGSHEGWIPIDSCSFKLAREETATDATPDAENGEELKPKTSVDFLSVKRSSDHSTADLLAWLANMEDKGGPRPLLRVDYCTGTGRFFLRYELTGVDIVSCSIGFSHPDSVSETLTFTYDYIQIIQRPIGLDGQVQLDHEHVAEYEVFPAEGS